MERHLPRGFGRWRSTIGDQRFEWSRHDVFTIPHWTWAAHSRAVQLRSCSSSPTGDLREP